MKHLDLLNGALKSDFLHDLFETYDVDVIYQYDRTHENLPDEYYADIPDMGLGFVFDENQRLKTLFITPTETTGHNPFSDDERLIIHPSKSQARQYGEENHTTMTEGSADLFGEVTDWIRLEWEHYSIHYEYVDSKLNKITLQRTSHES